MQGVSFGENFEYALVHGRKIRAVSYTRDTNLEVNDRDVPRQMKSFVVRPGCWCADSFVQFLVHLVNSPAITAGVTITRVVAVSARQKLKGQRGFAVCVTTPLTVPFV